MTTPKNIDAKICIICRSSKYLCGLAYCPVIVKSNVFRAFQSLRSDEIIFGSSPPSVFIGRFGYPKVRIGPVSPPLVGDTSLYDYPEKWPDLTLEQILEFRFAMIRTYKIADVKNVRERIVSEVQNIGLSSKPVDIEVEVERPFGKNILLDEHVPPLGPSAPLRKMAVVSNPSVPKIVERVYYDTDLSASEALTRLYRENLPISYLQKMFSVGALGKEKNRKLVPTRWAITAVDDIVSKALISSIKYYDTIDKVMVFIEKSDLNLFMAILLPNIWSYEWGEAWFPASTWNPKPYGETIIETDWESYNGRDTYASLGGCYYAARLAVSEYLARIKRQATAILWREIYPGFDIPIGVWFVREKLRKMFSKPPIIAESIDEALNLINYHSRVGVKRWGNSSKLLLYIKKQQRLSNWIADQKSGSSQ